MANTLSTIGNILGKIGGAVIKTVVPGGGLIIDAINAVLPADKQLPADATGTAATAAVATLPPDKQMELLSKEIDLDITEVNAWAQVQASLAEADKAGSSTRPQISLMLARVLCFAVVAFVSSLVITVFQGKMTLDNAWPLALSILGPVIVLLRAYFGMRSTEKKSRYSAAMGQPAQPNILGDIIRAFKN